MSMKNINERSLITAHNDEFKRTQTPYVAKNVFLTSNTHTVLAPHTGNPHSVYSVLSPWIPNHFLTEKHQKA